MMTSQLAPMESTGSEEVDSQTRVTGLQLNISVIDHHHRHGFLQLLLLHPGFLPWVPAQDEHVLPMPGILYFLYPWLRYGRPNPAGILLIPVYCEVSAKSPTLPSIHT